MFQIAIADVAATSAAAGVATEVNVDSGTALSTLLLCGLMGLLGQGARAIVGLKTLKETAPAAPSQQSEFSAAYLIVSLMIGFIAGVLAGLAIGLSNFVKINLADVKVLLGVAAAGYAGADFIENTLSIVIPAAGKAPESKQSRPDATASGGPNAEASGDRGGKPIAPLTSAQVGARGAIGPMAAAVPSPDVIPGLAAAFASCAHLVETDLWVPALSAAFTRFDMLTNRRMAAGIGQFLVEAGSAFQELVENLAYPTAQRIHDVFPREFPTVASAEPYVNNPEALGNRAYANKLGNGDEASGDGYRFRGRGLIQLTGREEYSDFGATLSMTAEQAAQYCETPKGAAMSGCWYLSSRGCLPLADVWALSKITRKVNGAAMLENDRRVAYSNVFLHALGN
jgi:predicted chitinase